MGDYGIQHFFIIHSADYAGPAYRATFSMQPILESTSYIYVSLMGYFLLKERFTRKKAAGIAVILLGIFIYSLKF